MMHLKKPNIFSPRALRSVFFGCRLGHVRYIRLFDIRNHLFRFPFLRRNTLKQRPRGLQQGGIMTIMLCGYGLVFLLIVIWTFQIIGQYQAFNRESNVHRIQVSKHPHRR